MRAVSGAVTIGIGSIFSSAGGCITAAAQLMKETVGQIGFVMIQIGTHAIPQKILSAVQGQSFVTAAISDFLGNLGASAFGAIAQGAANSAEGTVLLGAISGGNFWEGVVIGGLNHAMHPTEMQTESI
ncbi:hypothetical protein [Chryseobacterium jejuense]|uniref:hypothetical protein n=1 Tax=Chryseobacterium jejuense TaxID=445960 RepID=UPI001AE483FF|nr:hypothetical protein [Chryseobacterium jejuense]MBP2618382.1 hypothetical protein [Chryseobacterium jejuense]